MLNELYIKNFAIIDDLRIGFSSGLTILSGETGAGKSIIINAINLLLGNRASSKLIRTGAEFAEIEGIFTIDPLHPLAAHLKENHYDAANELIIRRIISSKDRHRIYINDRSATIQLLKTVTQNLVGITSQHAHQGLLQEEQQLDILDRYADLHPLRGALKQQYQQLLPLLEHLKQLESQKMHQDERRELLRYQKNEILSAALQPDEDGALEKRRHQLKNAESLQEHISRSLSILYSSDGAVMERLKEIQKTIEAAAALDETLSPLSQQVAESLFQLEEVVYELQSRASSPPMDPQELESIEDRLYLLQRLKKKYGGSLQAIIDYLDRIDAELGTLEGIDDRIGETASQVEAMQTQLKKLALRLSEKRQHAAQQMRKQVVEELAHLQMPQTEFQVGFTTNRTHSDSPAGMRIEDAVIGESGIDQISFLIAPNVGEPPKPLKSIASGGELSRVVLALKIISAESDAVETVIFDEVDAGIGGGVAENIGQKLSALSKYHQVICITHLPQIAKFGKQHYKIEKKVARGRTHTTIAALDEKKRLQEIARMLGGVKITQATLNHARDLLQST